jgi:serine/threonine protein phosphatase PrpC
MLVLCSDGVHKFLDSPTWFQVLTQRETLAQRCEDLIARARARGSVDDATILLVQRVAFSVPRPRWITRWAASGGPADMPRNAR